MDNVDYVLPEVLRAEPLWARVRDCLDGQDAIVKRGTKYLPMPNPADDSRENLLRYEGYQTRGVFMNFTQRTLQGMVGSVFGKDAVTVLPTQLMLMHADIDGGAVTLDQQAKQTLSDVIAVGRCGLYTDYPPVKKGASRKDMIEGKLRPTIQFYFAEDIINWRYIVTNGLRRLSLVVLREEYDKEDDGFKIEKANQYRVLRLEEDVYTVTVYRKGESGSGWASGGKITPKKSTNTPFDYIPFEFAGSSNNDAGIDPSPLSDLANLNIAHYRNSCDFEEMVHQLGQPTPVITGLDQEWVTEILGGVVILGSLKALLLPEGCEATLLQIEESQLALSAMEHKERQAVALGARLVQSAGVQRTAKEAGMEEASEQALILSAAKNVNSAYTRAFKSAALFAGAKVTEDMGYFLNTDFDILRLDASGRAQLLAEWQRGILTFSEYRSILKRAGVATLEDEEAMNELEAQAERDAATMGMMTEAGVVDEQVNGKPEDKNKPREKAGSPEDRSRKARGQKKKNG